MALCENIGGRERSDQIYVWSTLFSPLSWTLSSLKCQMWIGSHISLYRAYGFASRYYIRNYFTKLHSFYWFPSWTPRKKRRMSDRTDKVFLPLTSSIRRCSHLCPNFAGLLRCLQFLWDCYDVYSSFIKLNCCDVTPVRVMLLYRILREQQVRFVLLIMS